MLKREASRPSEALTKRGAGTKLGREHPHPNISQTQEFPPLRGSECFLEGAAGGIRARRWRR